MSGRLMLRRMTAHHIDSVVRLSEACELPAWSADTFVRELQLERRDYRVAVLRRRSIGFGGMMTVLDDAHLMVMGVDPAFRRRGVAVLLFGSLLEAARKDGCQSVTLEVRVENRAAQALYRRFGMTAEGVRPRYYEDGTDAVIMWHRDIRERSSVQLHRRLVRRARAQWNASEC